MKKISAFLVIVIAVSMAAVTSLPVQASGKSVCETMMTELPGVPADTMVTVTIVKIDLAANSVTLKDGSGKLWTFVVDPQVINLHNLRVGQKVTATISTTYITDRVTRAKISKQQLIKLQ